MSEVVRQRLELLVAQVQPRRALADEPSPAPIPEASPVTPDEEPSPGSDPHEPSGLGRHRARRAWTELGGRAGELGRQAWAFGRDHVAAVVLVLLVGSGWTAYSLLQARSTPVAVAAPPSVVASPTATPTPTPTLLVHLLGAVRSPGVVELADGSRVEDAIAAAGGLTRAGDPAELNLAAVVVDGSQIVIGTRAKPRGEVRAAGVASGGGQGSATGTISLNTATLEQLDTLPGVGPVTAQKILDWRTKHGQFTAVRELQEVDGIGPKTYADIASNVRV